MAELKIPKGVTQEQLERALKRLEREKEYREKMKNDPKHKAAQQVNSRKRRLRDILMLQKARAAGITVSDSEVDALYKKMYGG